MMNFYQLKINKKSFNLRVVLDRIRLFSTLISKIIWLWSELPLKIFGLKFLEKILILDFRIGSFAFGQNSTISCISSSQESDLLFIGIDYPSGGGGEIVIFNPFLSIRLKRIRNVF